MAVIRISLRLQIAPDTIVIGVVVAAGYRGKEVLATSATCVIAWEEGVRNNKMANLDVVRAADVAVPPVRSQGGDAGVLPNSESRVVLPTTNLFYFF